MTTDEGALSFDNVELTVSGWIFVPDPPGSYPIEPSDPRLSLEALVTGALTTCGLGDRGVEVMRAIREIAEPHFVSEVSRLEAVRVRLNASR